MANKKQFLLGCLVIIFGAFFYFVERPEGSTYLQRAFADVDSLFKWHHEFLRANGGSIPTFLHPLGFSLICMGLISRTLKSRFWICSILLWVDLFFEIGQKYHAVFVKGIPLWFKDVLILENTVSYFEKGAFSTTDCISILLGTITAFSLAQFSISPKKGGL